MALNRVGVDSFHPHSEKKLAGLAQLVEHLICNQRARVQVM